MPAMTIDEALKKQKRTATQIAEAVGVNPSFLSQIRRGKRKAPPELRPVLERELNAVLDFDRPPAPRSVKAKPVVRVVSAQNLSETAEDFVETFKTLAPLFKEGAVGVGVGVVVTHIAQAMGANPSLAKSLGLASGVIVAASNLTHKDTSEPSQPGNGDDPEMSGSDHFVGPVDDRYS